MKKVLVFAAAALVTVAVAASPAEAAKKKRAMRAAAPPPAATDVNEQSARFARDALVVFLPSWAMPIYVQASGRTW